MFHLFSCHNPKNQTLSLIHCLKYIKNNRKIIYNAVNKKYYLFMLTYFEQYTNINDMEHVPYIENA